MNAPRRKPRRGRPSTGEAVPAAERMRLFRARRKAEGLKAVTSWVPDSSAQQRGYSSHRMHDVRSLAMHALITQKIQRDPQLLEHAHANLRRWALQRDGHLPPALAEWQAILARPWTEIASLLTEQSEKAIRLRQSSPFAGVLKPMERKRIHDAFRT